MNGLELLLPDCVPMLKVADLRRNTLPRSHKSHCPVNFSQSKFVAGRRPEDLIKIQLVKSHNMTHDVSTLSTLNT